MEVLRQARLSHPAGSRSAAESGTAVRGCSPFRQRLWPNVQDIAQRVVFKSPSDSEGTRTIPMPAQKRVEDFVEYVRAGRYVEALQEFYADTAVVRENLGKPRAGLAALIEHEKRTLANLKNMRTHRVGAVLIDGDRVAINWVFEMTLTDGSVHYLDELALQEWQHERINTEQFYFDVSQLPTSSRRQS